jgi:hypothetical protein
VVRIPFKARSVDNLTEPLPDMRALRSSLVCLALSSTGIAHGEGVLIYKNQPFHPDSAAYAFRYDRIEGEGFVTWVVVGKERKRFEKTQFHIWIELPTVPPAEVTSTHGIQSITAQRDEIQKTCTRFPNAAPIAKKSLELHNEWCRKLADGMVRHRGEWMTKKDHVELLAKEAAEAREAKDAAARKRKEIVELEMEQKLAKEQEARQREEAARTALVDAKKAELRELQDEIDSIEEATGRLIEDLETLAGKQP